MATAMAWPLAAKAQRRAATASRPWPVSQPRGGCPAGLRDLGFFQGYRVWSTGIWVVGFTGPGLRVAGVRGEFRL